jgi:hypothetical protein
MHQRTHERLWSEVRQAEMRADERVIIFLERLKRDRSSTQKPFTEF